MQGPRTGLDCSSTTRVTFCFAARQRKIEIRVGDNSILNTRDPRFSGNLVCWADLSGAVYTGVTTHRCSNPYGISGQYVSIQYVDVTDYLTLCEVQVFGPSGALPPAPPPSPPPPTDRVELSLGRSAYQSSTNGGFGAFYAADGVTAPGGDTTAPLCSRTNVESNSYW